MKLPIDVRIGKNINKHRSLPIRVKSVNQMNIKSKLKQGKQKEITINITKI